MLQIDCPWCGPRDQSEFTYAGEAHITRPDNPTELTDEQWAEYLFMRKNTMGAFREQWYHAHGCHQFFNAERDTVTNAIKRTYVGEGTDREAQS